MNRIARGIEYARRYGAGRLARKALEHEQRKRAEAGYEDWLSACLPSKQELISQREKIHLEEEKGNVLPMFSVIVPVYRTPEPFLRAMVESVLRQSYDRLELCIADGSGQDTEAVIREYMAKDGRICYRRLPSNLGIAGNTNAALALASGDFICLLDHDDMLAPNALYELYRAWRQSPDTVIFYTDEDKVDAQGEKHFCPHFKPDFNRELLRSNNYICHLFCVKREAALEAGGFRQGYDGAQDYDFILRCTEKSDNIRHIPMILYHWRNHEASTAMNPQSKGYAYEAGQRAVAAHLHRMGETGRVRKLADPGFYRVQYQLTDKPDVTMIVQGIYGREEQEDFQKRVQEITDYPSLRLLPVPSRGEAVRILANERRRNGLVLFLDKDALPAHKGWLRELASFAVRGDAGCAGPRIYGPWNRLVSAGEVIGMFGRVSACPFEGLRNGFYGYMHKAGLQQECSVVSGSCLLVRKSCLLQALRENPAMMEETSWHVTLCLALREMGLRNYYTPFSVVRLGSQTGRRERESMAEYAGRNAHAKWARTLRKPDPFYHPALSMEHGRWVMDRPDK